jgi:hypothetical protein
MKKLILALLLGSIMMLAAECRKNPDSDPTTPTQKQHRRPGADLGHTTPDGKDIIEQWQLILHYTDNISNYSCGPGWWANENMPAINPYRLTLNWTDSTYSVFPCFENNSISVVHDTIEFPLRRGNFHFIYRENAPNTPREECVYSQFIFDGSVVNNDAIFTYIVLYQGEYNSYPTFSNSHFSLLQTPNIYLPHIQYMMFSPGETMNWSYSDLGQAIFRRVDTLVIPPNYK